jgi:hypothetical protein
MCWFLDIERNKHNPEKRTGSKPELPSGALLASGLKVEL